MVIDLRGLTGGICHNSWEKHLTLNQWLDRWLDDHVEIHPESPQSRVSTAVVSGQFESDISSGTSPMFTDQSQQWMGIKNWFQLRTKCIWLDPIISHHLPSCLTIPLSMPCCHMPHKIMTSRSCERQSVRTTTKGLRERSLQSRTVKNTKQAEGSLLCAVNVSLCIKLLLIPSESHLHVLTPSLIVYLFIFCCFNSIKPN